MGKWLFAFTVSFALSCAPPEPAGPNSGTEGSRDDAVPYAPSVTPSNLGIAG